MWWPPHFYARYETPEEFLRKRDHAEEILRAEMKGIDRLPQLSVGAEVYFFRGISESEFLPQLTIQGNRCILIEMPPSPWTESMYRELENIWCRRQITPVIAHIDRYIRPFRTFGIPERLAELPVLVQANAGFFWMDVRDVWHCAFFVRTAFSCWVRIVIIWIPDPQDWALRFN